MDREHLISTLLSIQREIREYFSDMRAAGLPGRPAPAYIVELERLGDELITQINAPAQPRNIDLPERAKLLKAYPDLAGDSSLRDAGLALATGVASKVESKEYSAAAETGERKTGIVGSVTLVTTLKSVSASEAGPHAVVAALGSVWGLDCATGRLLWRRGAC